jgi:hypothetical protein
MVADIEAAMEEAAPGDVLLATRLDLRGHVERPEQ